MSFRSVSKKHILGDYDVIEPPKIGVNGVGAGVPHNFLKSMYKKSPLSQKNCFGHEITAG